MLFKYVTIGTVFRFTHALSKKKVRYEKINTLRRYDEEFQCNRALNAKTASNTFLEVDEETEVDIIISNNTLEKK